MIEDNLHIILPLVFLFMVFFVGGYVFLMLNIMRADQNDIKSRKEQGFNRDIIPKKIKEIKE
ncbi:MAG TPA: hypothetical protein ENK82_01925 [Campylobacterales bacterium]|nr:hypothetical protein [Campylobacterales bacterium]